MAPTPSPTLIHSPSGKQLHRLRRQALDLSGHSPRRASPPPSRTEQSKVRILDAASQPSAGLEGQPPPPPPVAPSPSGSMVLSPEPSVVPVGSTQPQGPTSFGDIPGNIVAAVVLAVLVLGGLIGLVVSGGMLRRRARNTKRAPPPHPRSLQAGYQRPESMKNGTGSPQQRAHSREKFLYDGKTFTRLAQPAPVLSRDRQRRLSDVWPIRRLSQVLNNRRSCPEQLERGFSLGPKVNPRTTWAEFPPVSFYVAPPRTVLACIPEEPEERQSQTNSDVGSMLGGVASLEWTPEGAKSLESTAPEMTPDGDSSRSSMGSLESLGERESLRDEVFELKRAQTRSMQMNKGVLLSLSFKDLDEGQNEETVEGEVVILDEFPSPPSILPMIPSFVSTFS